MPGGIVLLSGGIDSTCCIHVLKNSGVQVEAIHVDYGQLAAKHELRSARRITEHFGLQLNVISVHGPRDFADGEIRGRNGFLIHAALMYANLGPGIIAIGIHSGTPYFDCSPLFASQIDALVSETTGGKNQVVAPFLRWTKSEIYQYFKQTGIAPEMTYSCEVGVAEGCGTCASCLDRRTL